MPGEKSILYRLESQFHGGKYVLAPSMEDALTAWRAFLAEDERLFHLSEKPEDWQGEWPGNPTDFTNEQPDSIREIDSDGVIVA